MTYFKVDDGIWGHPKFSLLSNDAIALWVMAGSWCGRYVTDGLLPFQSLPMVRGSKPSAQELVDAGLWLDTPNGWLFHDWQDYQYTKAEVESRREYEREKKKRQRDKSLNNVPDLSPGESRGESLRESLGSPGEGEGEGKGEGSLVLKNNETEKFEEFWKAYPKKADKAAARKAWPKALRSVDADSLVAGALRYRDDPNREDGFTKNAATWLNAGSWDNDPLPPRGGGRKTGGANRMDSYAAIAEKLSNGLGQIGS